MLRYLIRRLFWAFGVFIAVTIVLYVMFFRLPVDPARAYAGGDGASVEEVQRAAKFLGTDDPVWQQYVTFLGHITIDHSLGTSFASRRDVNEVITAALPITASLVIGGALLWIAVSIPLGVAIAARPRAAFSRFATIGVLMGISLHPVWIGLMLSYVFGYVLGWLPISGYCSFAASEGEVCGGPVPWFTHLVLPWLSFATLYTALYVRMVRASVMEVLDEEYVRTARAKGVGRVGVLRQHALRNALIPVVTMLGMDIAIALGGAALTEQVFGLQGIGWVALRATSALDLPVLLGVLVVATTAVIVFNLVVDLVYMVLDPRVRV